jgi:hypothetical protein
VLARAAAHKGPTRPPQVALRTQEIVDVMSSDKKVLDFPKAEITSAEKVRRAMAEAKRLASLAPGEWRLWIDRAAERLGVPRATLEGLISAIIKDGERKAREDKAEARRQEERIRREQRERKRQQQGIDKKAERKSKEKQKAFERLISLPSEQHETRLAVGLQTPRIDLDCLTVVRNGIVTIALGLVDDTTADIRVDELRADLYGVRIVSDCLFAVAFVHRGDL